MIRHWSTTPESRISQKEGYLEPPYDPIFEDERQTITELPLPAFCVKKSAASL